MRLIQAIYGEKRKGHGLLMSTDDGQFSSTITSKLDLPDTAPPNVEWSPYVSGFPCGDRYVIARTFLDPNASRAGMALSHALIVPTDEIARTANLLPLFAQLLQAPCAPEGLASIDIDVPSGPAPEAEELTATAVALVDRVGGTVVRMGVGGFEDLVAALWFRLWPETRATFSFRLSFGPQDLTVEAPPTLVCTPTALAARWSGCLVVAPPSAAPPSGAASILLGLSGAEAALAFGREIGARLDTLPGLPLLDRVWKVYTSAASGFADLVSALRLIGALSPDPKAGIDAKVHVLERTAALLPTASPDDILLLRNLDEAAFPNTGVLWSRLSSWTADSRFAAEVDVPMRALITYATAASGAVAPWREAVLAGLRSASEHAPFAAAFWRWATADQQTVPALFTALAPTTEAWLAKAAPTEMPVSAADAVMEAALALGWMHLHGAAAGAGYPPTEAVRRQLAADPGPGGVDGVRAALRRAKPEEVVGIAVGADETRLLEIAAQTAAKHPGVLANLDFSGSAAQMIWARALAFDAKVWNGPANAQAAFGVVIDALVDGGPANADLLNALSRSPLADLCNQPRRTEVWNCFAEPARSTFLQATAAGWITRASAGIPFSPESPLQDAILRSELLQRAMFEWARTSVKSAIQVIAELPGYEEQRFIAWLDELTSIHNTLPPDTAEAIGRLVLTRHWQAAVTRLVAFARKNRNDIKVALRVCQKMVSFFDTWWLGIAPLSGNEKWAALEELASELYPKGPDDLQLWSRAGGRESELRSDGDGRSRWHYALSIMQKGSEPRADKLLSKMKDDFPHNEHLRYMAQDREFGGRT